MSQLSTEMATKTQLFIHLVAIVRKINHMAVVHYSIIPDRTSKNLLQRHAANHPCDWEPSLSRRSEGIELDVPEYQHGSVKWMPPASE
jgi:hypothetical protein